MRRGGLVRADGGGRCRLCGGKRRGSAHKTSTADDAKEAVGIARGTAGIAFGADIFTGSASCPQAGESR
jgi:hypothetical protein